MRNDELLVLPTRISQHLQLICCSKSSGVSSKFRKKSFIFSSWAGFYKGAALLREYVKKYTQRAALWMFRSGTNSMLAGEVPKSITYECEHRWKVTRLRV